MNKNLRRGILASVAALGAAAFLATALPVEGGEAYRKGETAAVETAPMEKVNVNTASAKELSRVEGIGKEMAKAIVSYRDEHGPFQSWDDLREVKGIGEKELESLRDRVTLE